MRRLLHGLLGATLLLGACGGDDDDGRAAAITSIPEETSTSTSSTTTEPRTVAPDVIPQDVDLITEEYVEQVLNELFVVSRDAIVAAREDELVDTRSIDLMTATSSDAVLTQRLNDLIDMSFNSFDGIRSSPEPLRLMVIDLLQTGRDCVVAEVETDASGLLEEAPVTTPDERDFVRLLPASEEQRAAGLNPTAWVLDQFPVTLDGSVPDLSCPA